MAEVSAALVKQLRDKTGAGMMNCKAALVETAGDLEGAEDWLRKKGLSSAAKKADRVAAEGLICVGTQGPKGALVELNSETDFVARNELFCALAQWLGEAAVAVDGDLAALKQAVYPETNRSVEDEITHLIATVGENMNLRRSTALAVDRGVVAGYAHAAAAPGVGRIGVLVALESPGDADKLLEFGKKLAMHVAAARPEAVTVGDLDPALVARERNVLTEQAKASGKPDNVVEKMVEGRLKKFYQDAVLLEQIFVVDGESKVFAVVEAQAAEVGGPIKVAGFERYVLGEGIKKNEGDFAAEVAAQLDT